MGTFLLWFQGDTFNVVQQRERFGWDVRCPAGAEAVAGAFTEGWGRPRTGPKTRWYYAIGKAGSRTSTSVSVTSSARATCFLATNI